MINLIVENGFAYIWNAEDWFKLYKEHRILGNFDGAQSESESYPNNKNLPLKLSKIETQYLIKYKIGRTIKIEKLRNLTTYPTNLINFLNLRKKRIENQIDEFKLKRRSDIELIVDKIIDGKRQKFKSIIPDRNVVIQDELDKIKSLPFEMIQIDLVDVWISADDDYIPYEFPMPKSQLEILRFSVFEDFHCKRKYFVTSGIKFGGDFLAYPGHPSKYHAKFIIICQENNNRQLIEKFLISHKRLANSVKKILLIATFNKNSILEYKQI